MKGKPTFSDFHQNKNYPIPKTILSHYFSARNIDAKDDTEAISAVGPEAIIVENAKKVVEGVENNQKGRKVGIRVSYDGAWLKKGSGRCYNSKQGHGTAFGHYSRKCIAYGTRNKSCRFCSLKSKKKHDCRRNFQGSSKAMEADIAVEILTANKNLTEENVEVRTLIGDEDACTIANIRRASNHTVEKWTDINHATRKVSKFLYGLKKISKAAIDYLLYCLTSALRANKGDVEATRAALLNIVPHAFGEHGSCGSWCLYANDPSGFRHKYLPGGKPLAGEELKAAVLPIFKQAAENAEKLAPAGSSQINEMCNSVITTKAPKAKHYCDSSSSDFRVAAGISQVNLGSNYIDQVYSICTLSPLTKKSLEYRLESDRIRTKRTNIMKTPEFKKRRRILFKNRLRAGTAAEGREGITYQGNSELSMALDVPEKYVDSITLKIQDCTQLVIFDIETTGLRATDEIVQIAAQCNTKTFNSYIMPSCTFSSAASSVTGLTVTNGQLLKHSIPLETVSPQTAITGLIEFLKSVSSSVVLAAHNGHRFDAPRILSLVNENNMLDCFQSVVVGFTDTLPFLRNKLPERRKEKKSFSQAALANDYLSLTFIEEAAHDASVDVYTLQQLIFHKDINISPVELMHAGSTVDSILQTKNENSRLKNLKNSLAILKVKKTNDSSKEKIGISAHMINKLARSGISLDLLQKTYRTAGFDGLKILLA